MIVIKKIIKPNISLKKESLAHLCSNIAVVLQDICINPPGFVAPCCAAFGLQAASFSLLSSGILQKNEQEEP